LGREILKSSFDAADFEAFKKKLQLETAILHRWFKEKSFVDEGKCTGLEVEYWLVDENFLPAARNEEYLEKVAHPLIVSETSRFNAELNSAPVPLKKDVLSRTYEELKKVWKHAQGGAEALGLKAVMVGSLPTLRDTDLGIENLSNKERYRALNAEVMRLRKGRPIHLDIEGKDHLEVTHTDMMLEACATSMQCHLQVEFSRSVPYFNASMVLTPLLVALAANAPYLFGQDLWDETRIPIFEQGVRMPHFQDLNGEAIGRVGFGTGYVRESLLELFLENLDGYPVLLPMNFDEDLEWLSHLRLHNGNIWRWVRPIVGLTRNGLPHLRIEQRAPSSGPTLSDIVANFAFFLGATHWLATQMDGIEERLPFAELKLGFYEAAKHGLSGKLAWIDGKTWNIQELLVDNMVKHAREGLQDLGVDACDIEHYLDGIILPRARAGLTGTAWQRAYVSTHGKDFQGMVQKYFSLQEQDLPVHEWTV